MTTRTPAVQSWIRVALGGLLLAWALPLAAQTYTTATIAACPNDGVQTVCVVFSGPGVTPTEAERNRYQPRTPAELAAATAARKKDINLFNTTRNQYAVGTIVPDPDPPKPDPDDQAVAVFAALVQQWETVQGKNAIAQAFGTGAQITAAANAIIANYDKATPAQKPRFDAILATIKRVY